MPAVATSNASTARTCFSALPGEADKKSPGSLPGFSGDALVRQEAYFASFSISFSTMFCGTSS